MTKFFKKYWTALTAIGSMMALTASILFWLDATYLKINTHHRDLCQVRNDMIVLGNGLSKVGLAYQRDLILIDLSKHETIQQPNQAEILKRLGYENDLSVIQALLIKVESADLEDLKNVCE